MGLQELFDSYDKKKRKSHFKNLLAVAGADGKLQNIEFDYIMKLAEKCYMTPSEVQRVIESPGAINFHPPKTTKERIDQIYDLVTVMLVDGEINSNELELCKLFAMKLGFRPAIIDKMIEDLIHNALKGVAAEIALEEAIKNYD